MTNHQNNEIEAEHTILFGITLGVGFLIFVALILSLINFDISTTINSFLIDILPSSYEAFRFTPGEVDALRKLEMASSNLVLLLLTFSYVTLLVAGALMIKPHPFKAILMMFATYGTYYMCGFITHSFPTALV